MPTREKLESALKNAHAAGDADAAKKLANALKAMDSASVYSPPSSFKGNPNPEDLSKPLEGYVTEGGAINYQQPSFEKLFDEFGNQIGSVQRHGDGTETAWDSQGRITVRSTPLSKRVAADGAAASRGTTVDVESTGEFGSLGNAVPHLKMLVAADPEEQAQILQEAMPGSRAYLANDGKTWMIEYDNPEGDRVYSSVNKPGLSSQDVNTFAAQTLPWLPVGRGVMAVKSLAGKMLASAGGSYATQSALEKAQEKLGGSFDSGEVNTATALGPAMEMVGPAFRGIKGARESRRLAKMGAETQSPTRTLENIETAEQVGSELNIRTGKHQKTENPIQVFDAEDAGQSFGGAVTMKDFYGEQNKDIIEALGDKILKKAGPNEGLEAPGMDLKNFAKSLGEFAKQRREELSSMFYNRAKKTEAIIPSAQVRNAAALALKEANNPRLPVSSRIREFLPSFGKGGREPTLAQLHAARKRIDNLVDFESDGKLDVDTDNALRGIRKAINRSIQAAAKNGSEDAKTFLQGDSVYAAMSPHVEKMTKNSIWAKLAKRQDVNVELGTFDIFSSKGISTAELVKAKGEIQRRSPELWNRIYRAELDNLLSVVTTDPKIATDNLRLPHQIENALFKKGTASDRLLALAPSKEFTERLNLFRLALRKAQLGRDINSKSAQRLERSATRKQRVPSKLLQFKSTLINMVDSAGYTKLMKQIAEGLTDADWKPVKEAIGRHGASSPQFEDAITRTLLVSRAKAATQAIRAVSQNEGEEDE